MTMNTERVPAQQKSKLYTKPAGPPLCMMILEYGFSIDLPGGARLFEGTEWKGALTSRIRGRRLY